MSNFIVQVFEHEISTRVVCINGKHTESISSPAMADSSPVVSKLSLLINYLLRKRLGYARGEVGKARGGETPSLPSPFFLPVIPFVKEPVLVFHAEY